MRSTPEQKQAALKLGRTGQYYCAEMAPIASHLLYTQPGILRDEVSAERKWGIDAGLAWRAVASASVVYTDRGMSSGMEYGIAAARASGIPVEFRTLAKDTA